MKLDPRRLKWWFLAATVLLVVLNATNVLLALLLHHRTDIYNGYLAPFNLDSDGNVPTLFASLALAFAAYLLVMIGTAHRRASFGDWGFWYGLAAFSLLIGVSEVFRLHDYPNDALRSLIGGSGVFRYAWATPYLFVLVGVIVVYLPFVRGLPTRIRRLLIISGVIFIAGAVVMEAIGGIYRHSIEETDAAFLLMATLEGSFELLGIALLVFALLDYIEREPTARHRGAGVPSNESDPVSN